MAHPVTWSSLFGVGFILGGLCLLGVGGLAFFAGSMSDAPTEGENTSSLGCTMAIIGAALLGFGVWLVR